MSEQKLRAEVATILGCRGDWCWPCSHLGQIDRLVALLKPTESQAPAPEAGKWESFEKWWNQYAYSIVHTKYETVARDAFAAGRSAPSAEQIRREVLEEAAKHPQHHIFDLVKGQIVSSSCGCGARFSVAGASCKEWQDHIRALAKQQPSPDEKGKPQP